MNSTTQDVTSLVTGTAEKLGWFFYIIRPSKSTFRDEHSIPNYVNSVIPLFMGMIVIEYLINTWKGMRGRTRLSDGINSMSHGLLMTTSKIFTGSIELIGYQWLYEHRFIDLDWSSPVTWWVAAIGTDFAYYWFHRAVHEVSFFWASHQVHHSSEDYNLTTALRQSIFQRFFSFGIQQPLALIGVPLPALLVHYQFNLLYQFWIHTEVVSNIGPLEWIFNTASHHRVHHGMNKWCLDKNYAGVLIIWDRMFGTFQKELYDEKIVYGLVHQPQKYNTMWGQLFYFKYVIKKSMDMETWTDKLKALFYGPGWFPGTPRLGDPDALPDKTPTRKKYDPRLPTVVELYIFVHFFVTLIFQQELMKNFQTFSMWTVLIYTTFVFVSLTNIGALYDGWKFAPFLEVARCLMWTSYISPLSIINNVLLDKIILTYLSLSVLIWTSVCVNQLVMSYKKSKSV